MKYKHIIFDIDGTMLDSSNADLKALQMTIEELQGEKIGVENLHFALGIPGEAALSQLGISDVASANKIWTKYFRDCFYLVRLFQEIEPLLKELKEMGLQLGIITSKNRSEYAFDFVPFGLTKYFGTVICVDDSPRPKPSADPMLKYLEVTGASKEEVIYIGDTAYDMQCASDAGVDFGLARWGCKSAKPIFATHYFDTPNDIAHALL